VAVMASPITAIFLNGETLNEEVKRGEPKETRNSRDSMRLDHFRDRRLARALPAWTLLALIASTGARTSLAQQPNGGISLGRDEKAVEEALQGWWSASMKTHNQRIAWWRKSEFGCFIHWGVYSTFGGEWNGKPFRGYAEHMMRSQKIPRAEYAGKVVSIFNPVKFDAEEWVRLIKAAGMKYVIITAKHHDGFAMYPSSVSRYNIRDATPFKRDPMRELGVAARKHGLRFGFYYSHAFDWEHPDAPGNDWDYDNPAGDKGLHGGLLWYNKHPELLDKARKYVDEKAIPQIVELVKNYQPDILWFDTPSKIPLSENLRIMKAVREVAPNVVINGRLARGLGQSFGDYKNTGDRAAEMVPTEGDWETIPTTNESYGYHKHDHSHKPVLHFIQLMAKAAARGGNLLMNIGPMGNGRIDQKDQQILRGIGKWLAVNGKSIYRTERTPLPVQSWGESTRQGRTLYLHVFNWPSDRKLVVGGLKSPVTKVYLLANPQKVLKTTRLNDNDILIDVPPKAADAADTVIAVQVKGEIKANPVRLLASTGQTNVLRVFDGELHGTGLRFGDGKAPRAYVFEWKDPTQWVGWKVRVTQPSEFEISLKYTTGALANRGIYNLTIGDQVFKGIVEPTPNENQSATTTLGRVTLQTGEYEIAVKPAEIQGGELMRMFHISLTPIEAKR
jgi:alpha-L-fucosidase